MAKRSEPVCDGCGKRDDVHDLTVVYRFKDSTPWQVDLCQTCYTRRLGDLAERGVPAPRAYLRPQYRFTKTDITEANL